MILRYFKGTPKKEIWMKNNNSNEICGYFDVDGPKALIENRQPTFAHL
jgi:hypothetical protein